MVREDLLETAAVPDSGTTLRVVNSRRGRSCHFGRHRFFKVSSRTGEDNADAHMKRQVMGREVVVAITNGKLDFGPWEQIFYGEFDGKRPKQVLVKVIGE